MQICRLENRKGERGFTLVELAIVMIIIGLLIGGILKGQELIANAQVTATVSQAKGIDAAISTFRDAYDAFPGDMTNAPVRLPGCAANANCNGATAGNGNGRVDGTNGVGGVQVADDENVNFWMHLAFANLVTGISSDDTAIVSWGNTLPSSEMGGGFSVGWFGGGAPPEGALGASSLRGGHWIAIQAAPDAAIGSGAAGTDALTASQAARVDRKMDDGLPATGSVQPGGVGTCIVAGPPNAYNEANTSTDCGLYIRVQG